MGTLENSKILIIKTKTSTPPREIHKSKLAKTIIVNVRFH
jgi:hypothetical protein